MSKNITSLLTIPSPINNLTGWPWTEEVPSNAYQDQSNWPRISIVTPSYNQGDYIEETIRSILLQNYPNLQYIIIDGKSTDNTIQIIEKYSPWIDYWVSEPDNGQSHAINKGIAICNGSWFNWINSDDCLKPFALFHLAKSLNVKTTQIICGVTEQVQDSIMVNQFTVSGYTDLPKAFFSLGNNQQGSLLKISDIRACNGIREDLDFCMDLDIWLKILLRHGYFCIDSIPQHIAKYRYHSQSKTCSTQDVFALEEFSIITDIYEELSGSKVPNTLKYLRDQCLAKRDKYESQKVYHQKDISKAYFDRLLVNDSLLFRAIQRTNKLQTHSFPFFKKILDDLEPQIRDCYGHGFQKVIANAWLRAMQNKGSLYKTGILMTFKTLPFISTIKELARITVKGKR
ncbi:MAG: glycosyltransferase [Dolichospermum sp. BR01]|jgi:glycosyltransferase involved in cell wall biosynthesis|nr:glycosyltransferase [Dolichospermum sp. BR01]